MAVSWEYDAPEDSETYVQVMFTSGNIQHQRSVKAVFKELGLYDAEATETRVSEVALGVENKIACGVIEELGE